MSEKCVCDQRFEANSIATISISPYNKPTPVRFNSIKSWIKIFLSCQFLSTARWQETGRNRDGVNQVQGYSRTFYNSQWRNYQSVPPVSSSSVSFPSGAAFSSWLNWGSRSRSSSHSQCSIVLPQRGQHRSPSHGSSSHPDWLSLSLSWKFKAGRLLPPCCQSATRAIPVAHVSNSRPVGQISPSI